MIRANKIKNNIKFDIVVVGAGPIGIAFACGFADTNIRIAIIDKLPKKVIANPKIDGREIALTHNSVKILKKLNVWNYISNKSASKCDSCGTSSDDNNIKFYIIFNFLFINHILKLYLRYILYIFIF